MKNIDKIEKKVLVENKLREGMSEEQAEEEVDRDVKHIRNLNNMKKRLEREVKQIEKKKEKVSKQFKKQFKKLQDSQPDDNFKKKKTNLKSATTKHLNRIMYFLEEFPNSNLTKIAEENCMTNEYTRDGLVFLVKHKLLKKQGGSVPIYSLN